jgi:hypothetical protein
VRATLKIGSCQISKDGAGEVLNTCVDILAFVQFRDEWDFCFQVGLDVGPVSAPDIRSIRWVWKEERYPVSMSTGRWSERSAQQDVRVTEDGRSLVITMSRTSGVAERL